MANKRISGLPTATSTTTGDVVAIDGATTRSITVENFLTSQTLTSPILVTPALGVATATTLTAGGGTVVSTDPTIAADRAVTVAVSGGSHAIVDNSTYDVSDGAYAAVSFDAFYSVTATADYDHFASLQSRPSIETSGTTTNLYGFVDFPTIATGTVTDRRGVDIWDVTLASGGAVTTNYGIHIRELTAGGTNYAIFTEGNTPSLFDVGDTGIKIAPWGGGSTYGAISINGDLTSSGMVGIFGGATLDPSTLYLAGPTVTLFTATSFHGASDGGTDNGTSEVQWKNVHSKAAAITNTVAALNANTATSGGVATAGVTFGTSGSDSAGIYFGSGAPTISAPKGSLYLRTDGSATNDRAYINTNGTTTWTALTTAA